MNIKTILFDIGGAVDLEFAREMALDGAVASACGLEGVRVDQAMVEEASDIAVAAFAPDIVLVDMARPDRDALDGIRQVTARDPHPIVLFVDEDDPNFMEEAIGAGVSSYNVLGVPPPDVKPILRAATALFRRHQEARDGQVQAETQLKEREIVDRAKAILIRERRLGEPEAYRWLRKQAMTSGKRIADVARILVREKEGAAP